jgi:hypothetical protein
MMKKPDCPQCRKDFVKRIPPHGSLESLLDLVYLYSFRCQLCTRRFRALQWGVRYAPDQTDRRQYERISANFRATFKADQELGEGMVTDISVGGCSVMTGAQLKERMALQMQLFPEPNAQPILVEVALVCSYRAPTVGIEFVGMQPAHRERLSRYVHGLLMARR